MMHKEGKQTQYARLKMTSLRYTMDKTKWLINDKDVFIIIFNMANYSMSNEQKWHMLA